MPPSSAKASKSSQRPALPPHTAPSARRLSPWPAAAAIVVLTVVAYIPALRGDFVWDDDFYVTKNRLVKSPAGLPGIWASMENPQYYPLVFSSFWIEYNFLWGKHPVGYHAINILLHAVNSVLLWRLLCRLGVPGAWLAGAVFAVHPVCVESVAWITERKNVLSGLFYLSSIISFVRFKQDGGPRWYAAALVLYVMALLSKTATVMLPVALLLCCWWMSGQWRWRWLVETGLFFALSLAAAALTVLYERHRTGATGEEWSMAPAERLIVAGRVVWFYAGKLLVPRNLTFVYPRWEIDAGLWWQYLPAANLLVLFIILWAAPRSWGHPLLLGLAYYVASLFPVMGFFNVYYMRYSFVADHFQYFAAMGLIATVVGVAAWGLGRTASDKLLSRARVAPSALLLGVLGVLTWRQCGTYRDLETLWRETIRRNPAAWMAHGNLGTLLRTRGDVKEGIQHIRIALQYYPQHPESNTVLGNYLARNKQYEEAFKHYMIALNTRPRDSNTLYNLGGLMAQQRRYAEAIGYFRRGLEVSPYNVDILAYLPRLLLSCPQVELRDPAQAVVLAKRLCSDPEQRTARNLDLLAAAYAEVGRATEAVRAAREALSLARQAGDAHLAQQIQRRLDSYVLRGGA